MLSKTYKPNKRTESKVCYSEPGGLSEEAACELGTEGEGGLDRLQGKWKSFRKSRGTNLSRGAVDSGSF